MISKIEPSTNAFYVKGKFIKPPITRPNWCARKNLPLRSNSYQSHSTSNLIHNSSLIPLSTTTVVFRVIRYQTAKRRKEIRPVNLPNLIPIILAKTSPYIFAVPLIQMLLLEAFHRRLVGGVTVACCIYIYQ